MKYQNNGSELLWVFTIIVFNGGYSLNVTCSIIGSVFGKRDLLAIFSQT